MKLRASSLPALSKCGGWESKPFDTSLTLMGTARHDALEALVKNNDRTLIDALPAAEAEGVEIHNDNDLRKFDRKRKGRKASNTEWESSGDPDARIMKNQPVAAD